MKNKPTLVLAGSFNQFEAWCRSHGIMPIEGNYIYVSSPDIVRGREARDIILVGTWFKRKDAGDLLDECRVSIKP